MIKNLLSFTEGNGIKLPLPSDIVSLPPLDKLPFSIRVLLEAAVRNCDNFQVREKDVENILNWQDNQSKDVEIPFKPARVILQDFT